MLFDCSDHLIGSKYEKEKAAQHNCQ